MSEPRGTSRSLSEIGHLFLSSVRERQTNGAPLPKRQPPAGRAAPAARLEVSVDLTPEEFAHVCGTAAGLASPRGAAGNHPGRFPASTAIIGGHPGGQPVQSVVAIR